MTTKNDNDEILGSLITVMEEQEKEKSSKQQHDEESGKSSEQQHDKQSEKPYEQQQDQQSEKSSQQEIKESSEKYKEEQLEKSSNKQRVQEEETSFEQQKERETEKLSTSDKSSQKEIKESPKKQNKEQLEKSSKKQRVQEEETSPEQHQQRETEKLSTSEKSSQQEIKESFEKQKEEQSEKSSKKHGFQDEETSSEQQKEREGKKPSTSLEEIGVTAGRVIRCKAAVAWEANKDFVIESVNVCPPKAREARIKVKYTSLSKGDLQFWSKQEAHQLFPRIFGHEAVGIVESVGEDVSDLKVGDHVLSVFTGECGECVHCKSTKSNLCDLLKVDTSRGGLTDGTSRFSVKGNLINHFVGTSTFSEYTVVHSGCLVKINGEIPMDKVCLLSGEILIGLASTLKVTSGKYNSVAIFGLGFEGLAAAEGARLYGASKIIGVDSNCSWELAERFGVTDVVNPEECDGPVYEVIREMTNGGVDRSVDFTGIMGYIISAFDCVHDGWGVAVLAAPPIEEAVFMTKPVNFLSTRRLKETFFGNLKPKTQLPSFLRHCMEKKLDLDKFIMGRFPLSDINEVLRLMIEGNGLRYIISMED